MKIKKRSSYLEAHIQLGKKPITIWGRDKSDKFVCRLEINAAGLEVFSGKTGGKSFGNWNWEKLIEKLNKLNKK